MKKLLSLFAACITVSFGASAQTHVDIVNYTPCMLYIQAHGIDDAGFVANSFAWVAGNTGSFLLTAAPWTVLGTPTGTVRWTHVSATPYPIGGDEFGIVGPPVGAYPNTPLYPSITTWTNTPCGVIHNMQWSHMPATPNVAESNMVFIN